MRKFNVGYNERTNTSYYRDFEEIDQLPEIGDTFDGREVIEINEISMDCEQPHDDNFLYDLYEIVCKDEDVDTVETYVCIEKEIPEPVFKTFGSEEEIQVGNTYFFSELWSGDHDGEELLESGAIAVYDETEQEFKIADFQIVERDEDILKTTVKVTSFC